MLSTNPTPPATSKTGNNIRRKKISDNNLSTVGKGADVRAERLKGQILESIILILENQHAAEFRGAVALQKRVQKKVRSFEVIHGKVGGGLKGDSIVQLHDVGK